MIPIPNIITSDSPKYKIFHFFFLSNLNQSLILTVNPKPIIMKPYSAEDGHVYDFAFGINWKGVINDNRVAKYK